MCFLLSSFADLPPLMRSRLRLLKNNQSVSPDRYKGAHSFIVKCSQTVISVLSLV